MTYLQPHRRPYQTRARFVAVLIVGIFLIGLTVQIFMPHFFAGIMTTLAKPFWRTQFSLLSGSMDTPASLLAQNEELKRQLAEMDIRVATVASVEQENTALKAFFNRESIASSTHSSSRILAAVLKRPPVTLYDELIIDIGADFALSSSTLVYAPGNVLIGRVVDVLGTTAKVKLYSSPGEHFEVLIGAANTPATAIGRGGGQYEAQISRGSVVNEGDFVSSPLLNDRAFGIVQSVVSDPAQAFVTILFSSSVNLYELRWVVVDTKRKE
jgi:cell shape-determining protein MreC